MLRECDLNVADSWRLELSFGSCTMKKDVALRAFDGRVHGTLVAVFVGAFPGQTG